MPIAADIYYHHFEGTRETSRPSVVLIHGAGGDHLYWPPEIRRLPGYCVFALDLPGHGKSGGRGQQTISAYASSMIGWLAAIDLPRAVFVGHSMGGAIALSLALSYPERVLGLGLIGSGPRLHIDSSLLESAASRTTFHNAIEMLTALAFSPAAPAQLTALATRRMAEVRPSVLYGDLQACDAFDETDRMCSIKQPTLVVCGENDRMTPPRQAQHLAHCIQGGEFVSVPEAGHMVMLEQPKITARTLDAFLPTISTI